MDISLTKLPWYGQVGAFVLLAACGVGAFVYYYEMPTREDFKARQNQLTGLRTDISTRITDTKYGDAWFEFLASGRCVIGTESGSSALDPYGDTSG